MRKIFTAIGMASGLLLLPLVAFASPAGLVARYHLNTDNNYIAVDTSGNKLDGAISNPVSVVSGKFGNAYSFDGSGYVEITNNTLLEPAQTVSVEAWVKSPSSPGIYRYIVSKGAKGINNASYALYTGANGGLEFYISDSSDFYVSPDATASVWDNKWHYVVGTYDGTTVRLYVDGVQVGIGTPISTSIAYNLPDNNDAFIGTYNGSSTYGFIGQIDEVRIWNSTLSPDVISQHSQSNSVATTLETDVANE